ncbi:MAG: hypothetical protein LBN95_12645, partial [Prevotellaceae bacterium]|nr:hypothetical protein [Prevotellaceae bacterium]
MYGAIAPPQATLRSPAVMKIKPFGLKRQQKNMEEQNDIELKSEEFQEVLSRVPSWIMRWGITLIFIVLAVLIAGSWFFKYPEVLNAPIVVSTQNLPFDIVAKVSGRIDTL